MIVINKVELDSLQYKTLQIVYGFHSTPFGLCLIAIEGQNIYHISFFEESQKAFALANLQLEWPYSKLTENSKATKAMVHNIFNASLSPCFNFTLYMKGTDFQIKVWRALINIPAGTTISYEQVAHLVGLPKGVRAVANAIGKNHIAYLIPCHRVISKSGDLHHYKWGKSIKKILLDSEAKDLSESLDTILN